METTILITKPKTISSSDKAKLTKIGFTVIEHDDPLTGINFMVENKYVFVNCANCGDRIYLLPERISVLKKNHNSFYCSHGHSNIYN